MISFRKPYHGKSRLIIIIGWVWCKWRGSASFSESVLIKCRRLYLMIKTNLGIGAFLIPLVVFTQYSVLRERQEQVALLFLFIRTLAAFICHEVNLRRSTYLSLINFNRTLSPSLDYRQTRSHKHFTSIFNFLQLFESYTQHFQEDANNTNLIPDTFISEPKGLGTLLHPIN